MSSNFIKSLWRLLVPAKAAPPAAEAPFRRVFLAFRELLAANGEALRLMADMEEKASGDYLFDIQYLETAAAELDGQVQQLIGALEVVAGRRQGPLRAARERLRAEAKAELSARRAIPAGELVLPFERLGRQMALEAGGKAANIGEMKRLGLPVPSGFAVTTAAYKELLAQGGLGEWIRERLAQADTSTFEALSRVGHQVQEAVRAAEVPAGVAEAIRRGYDALARGRQGVRVAVRSSAVDEDSALSFAGQYATLLNLGREEIVGAWREVVASQFTPRALFYFKTKGLIEDEAAMAAACMEMVEAAAAGVAFSVNPDTGDEAQAVVTAVRGLGRAAVEGSVSPDLFLVDKASGRLLSRRVADKALMLAVAEGGGTREAAVPAQLRQSPALSAAQLAELAGYLRLLEEHFGGPQDVEFAVDAAGRLRLLQTRPLRVRPARPVAELARPFLRHRLLLEGVVASPGVAAGPVHHLKGVPTAEELAAVPAGAVVVVPHTSPALAPALPRISALVSDIGSSTGHLALLAREYGVPTLVDSREATRLLTPGLLVTVDAKEGKVYEGRVAVLIEAAARRPAPLPDTPVRRKLRAFVQRAVPLNLTDPRAPQFRPESCRTYHDITRYGHELAIQQMFGLISRGDPARARVVRLETPLPLNLHLIDLGGGITEGEGPVRPERLASVPMRALWRGISHPAVRWSGPLPVDVAGLLHIIGQTAVRSPEEFWDKTYAVVAADYVNYSSRLGYHFATVDSLCGERTTDNYVSFMFKGGAADEVRRDRRARFISAVLERLGFEVKATGDLVNAQLRRGDRGRTEEALDMLGRLMGAARQLDMRMSDESVVDYHVEAFLSGNYSFEPGGGGQP